MKIEDLKGLMDGFDPATLLPELDQVFLLKDRMKRVYRCMYCDAERSKA